MTLCTLYERGCALPITAHEGFTKCPQMKSTVDKMLQQLSYFDVLHLPASAIRFAVIKHCSTYRRDSVFFPIRWENLRRRSAKIRSKEYLRQSNSPSGVPATANKEIA